MHAGPSSGRTVLQNDGELFVMFVNDFPRMLLAKNWASGRALGETEL
jgi:hypothetical protein